MPKHSHSLQVPLSGDGSLNERQHPGRCCWKKTGVSLCVGIFVSLFDKLENTIKWEIDKKSFGKRTSKERFWFEDSRSVSYFFLFLGCVVYANI